MKALRYILVIGILGSMLIALLYFGILRFNYPSKEKYPIRGLDISHYQGEIDWQLIDTDDYKFIYIKATEGQDYQDPRFLDNWLQADKHGFDIVELLYLSGHTIQFILISIYYGLPW